MSVQSRLITRESIHSCAGADPEFSSGRAAGPEGAVLLEEGAPYLLKRAQPFAETAPFRARRAPLLAEEAPYLPTGRLHERKGAFSCQKGASVGVKGVVSA